MKETQEEIDDAWALIILLGAINIISLIFIEIPEFWIARVISTIMLILLYHSIPLELRKNYFSVSFALTFIFSISVFAMSYNNFVPYTYHALQNYSLKHTYYSAESFMEKDIALHRYVETQGMAFPMLFKESSIPRFDKSRIYFPKNGAEAYIKYPKITTKDLQIVDDFERLKKEVSKFVSDKENKGYSFYESFMAKDLKDILLNKESLEVFPSYKTFLNEINLKLSEERKNIINHYPNRDIAKKFAHKNEKYINYDALSSRVVPQNFKLLKKEFIQYYEQKLEKIYQAEKEILFSESIIYLFSEYEEDDYFYTNKWIQKIKQTFIYLSKFPKVEELNGIVQEKKNTNWIVIDDGYGYFSDALFLTLFWFVSLLLFMYHLLLFAKHTLNLKMPE